jgi:hypothetical protein
MASQIITDIERLRSRADEALARAEQMKDPESRRAMLDIVAGYERLAQRAERQLRGDRSLLRVNEIVPQGNPAPAWVPRIPAPRT